MNTNAKAFETYYLESYQHPYVTLNKKQSIKLVKTKANLFTY